MQHDAIKKKRAFSLAGQAERGEKANCLVGHFLHCAPEGMDGKGKERKGKETNKKNKDAKNGEGPLLSVQANVKNVGKA